MRKLWIAESGSILKLAEETFQQVKEKYEAFETAEIRAQYEEILQKYIVARDNMVDAQDYLNECMPIVKIIQYCR